MSQAASQIQSTAGAIPVINEKGEVSMQKVKVFRYVSGRKPKYAPEESSDEENEDDFPLGKKPPAIKIDTSEVEDNEAEKTDPRLRRLQRREIGEDEEDRFERHCHIHEPEVLAVGEVSEVEAMDENRQKWPRAEDESSEDEDLDEDEIEKRRDMLRMKVMGRVRDEEELMDVEDENKSESEPSEDSEYEEITDSEEEVDERLKPVFVQKRYRITVLDKDQQIQKEIEADLLAKRQAEEKRRETLSMIENDAKREMMEQQVAHDPVDIMDTDVVNNDEEYEAWKLRELKRIKRDKDARENYEKERLEIDRLRKITEEERHAEKQANPHLITNKSAKGKYKFLQKYYHRGAFFLNEENGVYKRDFSAPTLEDHFDKTVLPKVMQVKNFGRAGRTKYTHLLDQDTTLFDSPWMAETAQNIKFHKNQAGGMKQSFDRPSARKRKQ